METKSSNIPLWLTAGFVAGLGFAWLVLNQTTAPAGATAAEAARAQQSATPVTLPLIPAWPRDQAQLGQVEEFFMSWGGYCIWKNNVSQFVLWNGETGRQSDFYEVRRSNRTYYFRTLAKPDWPLIDHGALVRSPMGFAEPPEARKKFYDEHPDAVPGQTTFVTLPKRPPLLLPLPPKSDWDKVADDEKKAADKKAAADKAAADKKAAAEDAAVPPPIVPPIPPPITDLTPGAGK